MDEDKHRLRGNYHPSSAADDLDNIAGQMVELRDYLIDLTRFVTVDDETIERFAVAEEAVSELLHPVWKNAWEAIDNASERDLREVEIGQEREMPRHFWNAAEQRNITVKEYELMAKKVHDARRKRVRATAQNPGTLVTTGVI